MSAQLTNRDRNLFALLHSYGFLKTSDLSRLVFTGIRLTTVLRRLRGLETNGFIQRIDLASRGAVAWAVTEKAAKLVSELPPKKSFRPDLIEHDLKLLEVRLALEAAGVSRSWIPEHEIRHKVFRHHGVRYAGSLLVPDGIMGVETTSGDSKAVAIEVELNFKNSKRYERIFSDYKSRKTLSAVLYVVSDPAIGKAALKAWQSAYRSDSWVEFYWTEFGQLLSDPPSCELYGVNCSTSVMELWKSKTEVELGAQGTAHSVSTSNVEKNTALTTANP
jgi:hypothetical protein